MKVLLRDDILMLEFRRRGLWVEVFDFHPQVQRVCTRRLTLRGALKEMRRFR